MTNNNAMGRVIDTATRIGLLVDEFNLDGQWHRVPVEGKKASNRSGAYCLSELRLRNDTMVIVGMMQNWSNGAEERLTLDSVEGATPEDIEEAKRRARVAAEKAKKEKAQLQAETAKRAEGIWSGLPEQGKSDYLTRKKVKAWGVRFSRGSIVVPARDVRGKLSTLQFIDATGQKRFLTGGAKAGRFHLVGEIKKANGDIGIAEGYATAATIHESTGIPVAAAFDAGNLAPVALALRQRYPMARIIIFADHDRFNGYPQAFIKASEVTSDVHRLVHRMRKVRPEVEIELVTDDDPRLKDREKSFNIGVSKAILAAAVVDGEVLVPMV